MKVLVAGSPKRNRNTSIKNGQFTLQPQPFNSPPQREAHIVWGATEMNYRTIDILLSALKIPFVISALGGNLGHGWRSEGRLTVIVDSHNYREAAKLLNAAIIHGAIVNLSPEDSLDF